MLTKQGPLLGWGASGEQRVRNPEGLLRHVAHSLSFYGDGVSVRVVCGQSLSFRALPEMDSREKDSGRLVGHVVCAFSLFLTFLQFFWLVLVS